MTTDQTTYRLLDGSGLSIVSSGQTFLREAGKPVSATAAQAPIGK